MAERQLCSARWKTPTSTKTTRCCRTVILERSFHSRPTGTTRFFQQHTERLRVLVILPPAVPTMVVASGANGDDLHGDLNHVALTRAVEQKILGSSSESSSSFSVSAAEHEPWQVVPDTAVKHLLGLPAGLNDHVTATNPCPLLAAPHPHQRPRLPVVLCQKAATPFLWMPADSTDDNTTCLGLSLRDFINAVQPIIVKDLTKRQRTARTASGSMNTPAVLIQAPTHTQTTTSLSLPKKQQPKSQPAVVAVPKKPSSILRNGQAFDFATIIRRSLDRFQIGYCLCFQKSWTKATHDGYYDDFVYEKAIHFEKIIARGCGYCQQSGPKAIHFEKIVRSPQDGTVYH